MSKIADTLDFICGADIAYLVYGVRGLAERSDRKVVHAGISFRGGGSLTVVDSEGGAGGGNPVMSHPVRSLIVVECSELHQCESQRLVFPRLTP